MILREDGWYKFDKKSGDEYCIAPPIQIVKKMENIEDGSVIIVIDDGRGKTREESMDILTSQRIESLTRYGFGTTPKNKYDLAEALNGQAYNMPTERVYKDVGLTKFNDQLVFQGAELVAKNNNNLGSLIADSRYDLKPRGNLKSWIEMFKNHIQGTDKLELTVALGVSGVVFRYLFDQGIDLINPIVHYSGDSSTGKTTAAQLALSVAGNPAKNKGMYHSWNNTDNAFFSIIKGNYGVPLLFDEVSSYRGRNISQLVYQLADGNPRGRADKDGNLRKQADAATIIFSTGETNVTEHKTNSRNTGVGVRILEFEGAVTKSAYQSQEIKKTITHNYGQILPLIAKELIDSEPSDIVEIFDDHYKKLSSKLKNSSSVVERITNFYAAILTSVTAFNETMKSVSELNLNNIDLINVENIQALLVKYEQSSSQSRDIAEEVYEALLQYLIQNQHKISSGRHEYGRTRETIGHYEPTENVFRYKNSSEGIKRFNIKLLKTEFDQFIHSHQFEGTKKIQSALSDKGYIINKDDTRIAEQETVTTDGKKERKAFYRITIPDEMLQLFNYSGIDGNENELKPEPVSQSADNKDNTNSNNGYQNSELPSESLFAKFAREKSQQTNSKIADEIIARAKNHSSEDDLEDIEI